MPKFSDIAAGTLALGEPQTVEVGPGATLSFRFRLLAPFESSGVLTGARADAKAAGVDTPEDGEPIYEEARTVHTLAFVVVDSDSKQDDPKPYFDGGVEQIRRSRMLTPDVLAYLYELWEHWRDDRSLQKVMGNEADFQLVMEEAAVGNARPFLQRRPGIRWNYFRTMAARVLFLQRTKSLSGSGSPESHLSQTEQSKAQPAPAET